MHITDTIVIGCGGTGGHLIPPLARLLAYHGNAESTLIAIDGDEYEAHNASRQIMGEKQLGLNKAVAMQQHCLDQGLEIRAIGEFAEEAMLQHLLGSALTPLLVLAVDNDATRKLALKACAEFSGDFFVVTPGNADNADGTNPIRGNVLWWGQAGDQPLGCNPMLMFPNIEHPTDAVPRRGSCALMAPSAPQLIAANALAASLTLTVIQNLLDRTLPADASMLFFNGRTFRLTFS